MSAQALTDLQPPRRNLQPQPVDDAAFPLDRHNCGGRLSLLADGPLPIDCEPGLRIEVRAGCVWVPRAGEQVSRPLMSGDHATLSNQGPIWVMASRRTEIELHWPHPAR